MNEEYGNMISRKDVKVSDDIMKKILIDLSHLTQKSERGTHIGRVKVTRGGKTFWRKQRVGQKAKESVGGEKSEEYTINFDEEEKLKSEMLNHVKDDGNIEYVDGIVQENKYELIKSANNYLGLYSEYLDGKSYNLVSNIMDKFISTGSDVFGDMQSHEFCDLLQLSIDDIIYQELNSWTRQLGDHGIRHIYGNIDMMSKIFDSINMVNPGVISDKDKFNGVMAMIWHDFGYTTERSRSSIEGTHYHKVDSGTMFKHKEDMYKKFLGDDFSDVENYIINHDTPDIDWERNPVLSSISCADNLALFYKEKLPKLFREVDNSIRLLKKMQMALLDDNNDVFNSIKNQLYENIDKTNFPEYTKYLLKKAAKEVSPYSPKVTLSMLVGEISDIGFSKERGLDVKIEYNDFEAELSKLYDQGQSKFVKLAESFNITDFEKDHFEFIKDNKILISVSKVGKYVKIEIDIGSLRNI